MKCILVLALAMIAGTYACVDDRDPPEMICTPGAVDACACAGQQTPGAQTCSSDGTEYGSCLCCMPGAHRSCTCMSAGKVGQQDCSSGGAWGSCYACK